MIEHIVSPDGGKIWTEDLDVPENLRSKWIDVERWNEWLSNSRECPLCNWRLELEPEENSADCSHCNQWFNIIEKEPLTLEHNQDPLNKFWLPLKFKHDLLTEKGMVFYARGDPDCGEPDIDAMIDGINESMNEIKDSVLGIVQQAIDEAGDWSFIYDDTEIIDEKKPTYVIDEEE
jgi:hypothetical protein